MWWQCCSMLIEVRWDPLSGLEELNLELWSSTAALLEVIEDPRQFMTAVGGS